MITPPIWPENVALAIMPESEAVRNEEKKKDLHPVTKEPLDEE